MVLRSLSQKLLNLHEALSHQEGFMMMSSIINFTKDFVHFGNKFLSNSNKTDRSKILAYLRKFEPKGLLSSNFLIIPIINFWVPILNSFTSASVRVSFLLNFTIMLDTANPRFMFFKFRRLSLLQRSNCLIWISVLHWLRTFCLTAKPSKLWINNFKSSYVKGIMGSLIFFEEWFY